MYMILQMTIYSGRMKRKMIRKMIKTPGFSVCPVLNGIGYLDWSRAKTIRTEK